MFSSLRVSMRIARREALRHRGRSMLSIVLLGLPLLGASLAMSVYDTANLSPREIAEQRVGANDAYIEFAHPGVPLTQYTWEHQRPVFETTSPDAEVREVPESAITAALPDGATITPYSVAEPEFAIQVKSPDGVGGLMTFGYELSDPAYGDAGVDLITGAVPILDGQVAISAAAADWLKVGPGDVLEVGDGEWSGEYEVTAIVEIPWLLDDRFIIGSAFAPESPVGWLVDTPALMTHEDALALNELGLIVWAPRFVDQPPPVENSRHGGEDDPDDFAVLGAGLIATVVVLEVVLLAGPAFAISTRSRTREFALMSAAGATPSHLRRTVLAGGLLFGIIAAAVAMAIGIASVWAALPIIERLVGHRSAGLRVMPSAQAAIAALAIVTGLLSALGPAVGASRTNVVAALARRTPKRRRHGKALMTGVVCVAAGIASGLLGVELWSLPIMAVAIVLVQLGLVACAPATVAGLSRLGHWLPLSPRMALRQAGRTQNATTPAIAAVVGVVAGGVALSMTVAANATRHEESQVRTLPQDSFSLTLSSLGGDGSELEAAADEAEAILAAHLADLEFHESTLLVFGADCAPTAEVDLDAVCSWKLTRPAEHECSYWDGASRPGSALEEARSDPRCDERLESYFGSTEYVPGTVDPVVVAAYSELAGDDLRAAVAHLESGGILVSDPWAVTESGTAVLEQRVTVLDDGGGHETDSGVTVEVPAFAVGRGLLGESQVFLGPIAAERMGMVPATDRKEYLLESSTAVTSELQEAIDEDLELPISHGHVMAEFRVTDYRNKDAAMLLWAVAGLCGVVALGATVVSAGLILTESRHDITVLGAIGAAPGLRRRFSMWLIGVVSLLGTVLGTIAGLMGYSLLRAVLNRDLQDQYPFPPLLGWEPPWTNLTVTLLVTPAVAVVGALLFTRAGLPSERRMT